MVVASRHFDRAAVARPRGAVTGDKEKVFLTQSFDPTTHFETAIGDVLGVYKRITGKELELTDGPSTSE